jgi:hypothetical protein
MKMFESYFELGIVFLLQFIEPALQGGIGCQHLPQPDKCSHNLDINRNSAFALQNTLKHCHTLLGERPR